MTMRTLPAFVATATRVLSFIAVATLQFIANRSIGQDSVLVASPRAQAAEQRIRSALQQEISCSYLAKPLSQVVDELGRKLAINILLDTEALKAAGMQPDIPVSIRLQNVSAEAILNQLRSEVQLDWTIGDEALWITTSDKAGTELSARVYFVRDLVEVGSGPDRVEDYDSLIEVITSTISPETWSERGGQGSISCFRKRTALVICQSRQVHQQIERLLAALRKNHGAQDGVALDRPAANPSSADTTGSAASPSPPISHHYAATQSWNRPQVHR